MQPSRLNLAPRMPPCTVSSRWCLRNTMWSRRISAGSATQCVPGLAGTTAGRRSAAAASVAASAAITAATNPRIELLSQAHLDVAGGTDILADVAADALVVVGVDVAAGGRLRLLDLEHRGLRAVDDAVVALEAHPADHAALGLGLRLGLEQRQHPLLEVGERLVGAERRHLAPVARGVREVPEEQLGVRDHVAVRAVVVVVDRARRPV